LEKASAKFKERELHKRNQYKDVLLNCSHDLIPFIMDTVGNIGKAAKDFLVVLRREASKISKDEFVKCFVDGLQIILYQGLSDQSVSFYKTIEESVLNFSRV
jgi:hypothetical protein